MLQIKEHSLCRIPLSPFLASKTAALTRVLDTKRISKGIPVTPSLDPEVWRMHNSSILFTGRITVTVKSSAFEQSLWYVLERLAVTEVLLDREMAVSLR